MTATKELVDKARNGNIRAFEQLVTAYQDRVYAHCYQLTNNFDNAQDLAQDVFIQAFKGIKSFRNEADFGTWLHRITVNSWVDFQRKQYRLKSVSLDEPLENGDNGLLREIAASEESPLEMVERQELSEMIKLALNHLLPEYRTVLLLREVEGYSYDEMASMLGCSLGTVKSRISRGRRDLKKELDRIRCDSDEL